MGKHSYTNKLYNIHEVNLTHWSRVTYMASVNKASNVSDNEFDNVVRKMATILSRPQCVKSTR